jgi:hypothetical protein
MLLMSEVAGGKCGCGCCTWSAEEGWIVAGIERASSGIYCWECADFLLEDGTTEPTARLAAAMKAVERYGLCVDWRGSGLGWSAQDPQEEWEEGDTALEAVEAYSASAERWGEVPT